MKKKDNGEAKRFFSQLMNLGEEFIFALIDNPYECPIIIDDKGIIRYMSRFSKRLIGIDPDEAVGTHISDVIKDTRLHEIPQDGRARIADLLYIGGKQQVISRIPLKNMHGQVIGAVGKGVFNEVAKLMEAGKRIDILNSQLQYYQNHVSHLKGGTLVGTSNAMRELRESALRAANCNSNVLITGESGTGKEVVAQFIHQHSKRSKGPFIRLNCASIPHELFESELFGYESGAFTGALTKGKPGKFELAEGGTILLDEIGEMPMPMQVKLLRVLEDRTIDRLGSVKSMPVDFRLIAATNRDLPQMVKDGAFRMDLYYRINILHIHTPNLRSMREDIPLLVDYLISHIKEDLGAPEITVSEEAMRALELYHWPGNVRELRNVLERAIIVSKDRVIRIENLPIHLRQSQYHFPPSTPTGTLRQILQATEKG